MSNFFIRRRAEHGTLPRFPLQPKREEFHAVHPLNSHLTLMNQAGLDVSIERAAQILDEAPESIGESLTVRAARAIMVGQKAVSCSVALEIDDPTNTLLQEHEYFQTVPELRASQYTFSAHITLARGLKYSNADQLVKRLNRKLPQDRVQLQPVKIFIGSDYSASKESSSIYSAHN